MPEQQYISVTCQECGKMHDLSPLLRGPDDGSKISNVLHIVFGNRDYVCDSCVKKAK